MKASAVSRPTSASLSSLARASPGPQRYAAATWSGDVSSTWTALQKQIPAGLGFSLSGVPYWTTDSGGYTMESRFSAENQKPEDAEEWRELNTRCSSLPPSVR